MTCENIFCIYQKAHKCILAQINVDIMGACEDCIYVDIEQKTLDELKEKHLKDVLSRYEHQK